MFVHTHILSKVGQKLPSSFICRYLSRSHNGSITQTRQPHSTGARFHKYTFMKALQVFLQILQSSRFSAKFHSSLHAFNACHSPLMGLKENETQNTRNNENFKKSDTYKLVQRITFWFRYRIIRIQLYMSKFERHTKKAGEKQMNAKTERPLPSLRCELLFHSNCI